MTMVNRSGLNAFVSRLSSSYHAMFDTVDRYSILRRRVDSLMMLRVSCDSSRGLSRLPRFAARVYSSQVSKLS
jgi:hypothetical protein